MDRIYNILKLEYFGNLVNDYLIALGVLVTTLIAFKLFKQIVLIKIKKWAESTKTDIDDEFVKVIENIPGLFYTVVGIYAALKYLDVPEVVIKGADVVLIILVIFWATKAATEIIEFSLFKVAQKKGAKTREKTSAFFALSMVVKIVMWSVGTLLILSNLGVNISALVASMGIGGIAVALALQNILSDMFSSFSIYIDKPFEIGDYIVVGDQSGTVKKIGMKTTRVEALQGEEIVFSNRELTNGQVRNFKKMKKRRIAFGFGIIYDTSPKKMKAIPDMLKVIFKKIKLVDLDRAHFHAFGDFSLNYEVVYYIKSGAYGDYMDAQQKINLAIMTAFEKEGIEMAFPTQTIYLNK